MLMSQSIGAKGQYREALKEAKKIWGYTGRLDSVLANRIFNNIAINYLHIAEYTHQPALIDSAAVYNRLSTQMAEAVNDFFGTSQARLIRGYVNIYRKNFLKAEEDLFTSLKM